jgi:RimJ/RimL family protein N-acetyltransferase
MPFPDDFETPRLAAERLRPAHAEEIARMHRDADQMALLGGVRDDAQTDAYMQRSLEHWDLRGFGVWVLRDRATDRVAGRVLLRHLPLEHEDAVEVGYSFIRTTGAAALPSRRPRRASRSPARSSA